MQQYGFWDGHLFALARRALCDHSASFGGPWLYLDILVGAIMPLVASFQGMFYAADTSLRQG
jgi:hypothetical protein